MQLHQDFEKFAAKDTVIVAIGPENKLRFNAYWEAHNFSFYGIPDAQHRVLRLYGQEVKPMRLGRMPAQMLVDKTGVLRYVHYGQAMNDITSNEEILNLIDTLSD